MAETLPALTRDLEEAKRNLNECGYCLIADALKQDQLNALRQRLIDQAAGERAKGVATMDGGGANQRLWMLVNKGKLFRDLVTMPLVTELMTHLLGKSFLVSSLTANITGPGGEPMLLHRDQGYVSFYTPVPVVANIAWMLDDYTDENGATRLVPHSHLWPEIAPPTGPTIPGEGPAGTALFFDGRVWHGTGQNRTKDGFRHGILQYCCRPYIRQQENFFLGAAQEVIDRESAEFLGRLGFRISHRLGRTNEPTQEGILKRVLDPVGELQADGRALSRA